MTRNNFFPHPNFSGLFHKLDCSYFRKFFKLILKYFRLIKEADLNLTYIFLGNITHVKI